MKLNKLYVWTSDDDTLDDLLADGFKPIGTSNEIEVMLLKEGTSTEYLDELLEIYGSNIIRVKYEEEETMNFFDKVRNFVSENWVYIGATMIGLIVLSAFLKSI